MNIVGSQKRCSIIAAPVEGASINATCRMTGAAKHTVLKLLKNVGCAAASYHDAHVRNLRVRRVRDLGLRVKLHHGVASLLAWRIANGGLQEKKGHDESTNFSDER